MLELIYLGMPVGNKLSLSTKNNPKGNFKQLSNLRDF